MAHLGRRAGVVLVVAVGYLIKRVQHKAPLEKPLVVDQAGS